MASPPPPPRGGVATSRRRETRAHPLLVHRWPRDIKEQRARVSAGINAAEPSSACSRLPVKNIFRTAFSPLRGRKVADPSTFYSSIYPSRLSFSRTQRILSLSLFLSTLFCLNPFSLSLARSQTSRRRSSFTRDPFVSSHSLPRVGRVVDETRVPSLLPLFLFIATTAPILFSSPRGVGHTSTDRGTESL